MKFLVEENREKSREKPAQTPVVHQETHMESPRREHSILTVEGERLNACATETPNASTYYGFELHVFERNCAVRIYCFFLTGYL